MKFLLTKASESDFKGEGIDIRFNPRIEQYDVFDRRNIDNLNLFNKRYIDNWFRTGVDHIELVENNVKYVQRTLKDNEGCFIDIISLKDLIDFKNIYGEIIIKQYILNKNITEIMIYDDYIE